MPESDLEVVEYINKTGKNVFAEWMAKLDIKAFAKVSAAVARIRLGNFGDTKSLGSGVSERRIDYGPGYRIYFGKDGPKLVILLGGGTKSRQDKDIRNAQAAWQSTSREKRRKQTMGLTRPFIETIKERAAKDPKFRGAMLAEASECFLNGEVEVAKTMLRDYVNATIGFQALAEAVEKKPQSLMRMLSKTGNPRAENLSTLIASLKNHEGIDLRVRATR